MGFIFILFGLYNLGNIQNNLSRGITLIVGMGIAAALVVHMIGMHFGKSFIKFSINELKRDKWFEFIKLAILLVIVFTQFIYTGYSELTTRYTQSLSAICESRDITSDSVEFMEYNVPFTPKCLKQVFSITAEFELMAQEYLNDESKLEEWSRKNYDRIVAEAEDAVSGSKSLVYLLPAYILVDVIRRSRRTILDFIRHVKIAAKKRRT